MVFPNGLRSVHRISLRQNRMRAQKSLCHFIFLDMSTVFWCMECGALVSDRNKGCWSGSSTRKAAAPAMPVLALQPTCNSGPLHLLNISSEYMLWGLFLKRHVLFLFSLSPSLTWVARNKIAFSYLCSTRRRCLPRNLGSKYLPN